MAPSLSQEMAGAGWPLAAQSRVTVSPSRATVSAGVTENTGEDGEEVAGGGRFDLNKD